MVKLYGSGFCLFSDFPAQSTVRTWSIVLGCVHNHYSAISLEVQAVWPTHARLAQDLCKHTSSRPVLTRIRDAWPAWKVLHQAHLSFRLHPSTVVLRGRPVLASNVFSHPGNESDRNQTQGTEVELCGGSVGSQDGRMEVSREDCQMICEGEHLPITFNRGLSSSPMSSASAFCPRSAPSGHYHCVRRTSRNPTTHPRPLWVQDSSLRAENISHLLVA